MKSFVISSTLLTTFFACNAWASQPLDASNKSTIAAYEALAMSESDMDDVSAVSGINVLNIFGATAAGLTVDEDGTEQTVEKKQYQEGEDTQLFASQELKSIEESRLKSTPPGSNQAAEGLPSFLDETVIVGDAKNFNTTSEISYKARNFQHKLRQLDGESISISRNLQIDLLKIENLSGDHVDDGRSAGSIYLSDWTSIGDTTLTPRD